MWCSEMNFSKSNMSECYFEELNEDCVRNIFRYLTINELLAIRRVNRRWKGISEDMLKLRRDIAMVGKGQGFALCFKNSYNAHEKLDFEEILKSVDSVRSQVNYILRKVVSIFQRLESITFDGCFLATNDLLGIFDNLPDVVSFSLLDTSWVNYQKRVDHWKEFCETYVKRFESIVVDQTLKPFDPNLSTLLNYAINVKEFTLINNTNNTISFVGVLSQINASVEKITLKCSDDLNLTVDDICSISRSRQPLECLVFFHCHFLELEALKYLSDLMPKLKCLSINTLMRAPFKLTYQELEILSTLEEIQFDLGRKNRLLADRSIEQFFDTLSKMNFDKLKSFTYCGGNRSMVCNEFIRLCRAIQRVDQIVLHTSGDLLEECRCSPYEKCDEIILGTLHYYFKTATLRDVQIIHCLKEPNFAVDEDELKLPIQARAQNNQTSNLLNDANKTHINSNNNYKAKPRLVTIWQSRPEKVVKIQDKSLTNNISKKSQINESAYNETRQNCKSAQSYLRRPVKNEIDSLNQMESSKQKRNEVTSKIAQKCSVSNDIVNDKAPKLTENDNDNKSSSIAQIGPLRKPRTFLQNKTIKNASESHCETKEIAHKNLPLAKHESYRLNDNGSKTSSNISKPPTIGNATSTYDSKSNIKEAKMTGKKANEVKQNKTSADTETCFSNEKSSLKGSISNGYLSANTFTASNQKREISNKSDLLQKPVDEGQKRFLQKSFASVFGNLRNATK